MIEKSFRMKMHQNIVLCLIVFMLSGCLFFPQSVIRQGAVLDQKGAYFFGTYSSTFILRLKQITTNEKFEYSIHASDRVQVISIKPGDYIIVSISLTQVTMLPKGRISSYTLYGDIPEELMKVLSIRAGVAVYIGQLWTKDIGFKQAVMYVNDFANAKKELIERYKIPENMRISDFSGD